MRVAAGSLVAITAVALLVGLLISTIIDLRDAGRAGSRSQTRELRVARVLSDVVDLETGLRGYVITGRARFLQPYVRAAGAVDAHIEVLTREVRSSSAEHARAIQLRGQIDAYISRYAQPLIALVARDHAAALKVPGRGEGIRRVEEIRTTIAATQDAENNAARARQRAAKNTAREAIALGIVVLVALVTLIALLAYALQRLVLVPVRSIERGHRFATLLANASSELDSSLDLTSTLPRFCSVTSSDMADWCVVALGEDGKDIRVLAGDPERLPPDIEQLLTSGEVERQEQRICAPITQRGRTLGLLVLGLESGSFDEDDEGCATELARRVGLAVDTAWLYEQSASTARVLQDSLLPERLPSVAGLEIASRFRPAGHGTRVSGDFYDVFPTGPRRWAILVGDVCGKGAAAAAVTAMVRYTLRAHAREALAPADALRQLNEAMLDQAHDGRFVTIAYATLDLRGARPQLTVACGGHPPPLLVRAGEGAAPLDTRGTLIGVFKDIDIREVGCQLGEGDAIVLYSDGVTEARPGEAFTPEELAAAIGERSTAEELAATIDTLAMETTTARQDDVAILAVRYVHRSDLLSLELPSDVSAPGAARQALQRLDLASTQLDLASLLTSELVTNAVIHAAAEHGPVHVRATVFDGRLRLSVSDSGAGFTLPLKPRGTASPGGYGLALVERLADRWGIESGEHNTVWFELSS